MSGRDPDDKDGFLRRWSRLKSTDGPAPAVAAEENAVIPPEGDAIAEPDAVDDDEAAIADLPDIDSLDKDSDFTVFMREGVPEALRQRALRKLWLSDPVLANLDGLNDYDDDFGAIFREGAAYMKRLVDAGEKMTRPGADDETPEEPDPESERDRVVSADSPADAAESDAPEDKKKTGGPA